MPNLILLVWLLAATWWVASSVVCDAKLTQLVYSNMQSLSSTSCPENTWLRNFTLLDSLGGVNRTAIMVNIGCNKGFDAISALNLFRQEVVLSRHDWHLYTKFGCGVCSQCDGEEEAATPWARGRPTRVYCIEPLPANFERLNAGSVHFHLERQGFHTIHAAFTSEEDARNRRWNAKFPVFTPEAARKVKHLRQRLLGFEAFGIGVNDICPTCATARVPLMVLDRFVEEHHLPVIDYLSIDTEGNDPFVLLGANHSLHRVRYLEFEYHKVGVWGHTDLRDVIEQLKGHGFVCYWIGKGKVWRLTDCWHDAYGVRQWSNVGCVQQREREWYAVMEEFFNNTVPH